MLRVATLTALLLLIPVFLASAAQPVSDVEGLPNPSDYAAAGPTCKSKVKLSPWLSTPSVDFPKTSRCVLQVVTCTGVTMFKSNARPNGKSICADYQAVQDAFAKREVCCDRSAR